MDDVKDALADLDNAIQEMTRAEFNLPGWTYRDLPRMAPAFMDAFVDLVGEEHLRWITSARYPDGSVRGQVMISPEGMERIKRHNEDKANGHEDGAEASASTADAVGDEARQEGGAKA